MLATAILSIICTTIGYFFGVRQGAKSGVSYTFNRAYSKGFEAGVKQLATKLKLYEFSKLLPPGHTKDHLRHQVGLGVEPQTIEDLIGGDDAD